MGLQKLRTENFQAVLEKNENEGNEIYLKVTYNGHQWIGIALSYTEMEKVRELLAQELKAHADTLIASKQVGCG